MLVRNLGVFWLWSCDTLLAPGFVRRWGGKSFSSGQVVPLAMVLPLSMFDFVEESFAALNPRPDMHIK